MVHDASGHPMPHVRLIIVGTQLETHSDERGHFEFTDIPSERVVLGIEDPNVEPALFQLSPGERPQLISARYRNEERRTVVVRGALPQTNTASHAVVTARQIEAVPVGNAEDAMRLVPGVTLVQHGSEGKGHQFFLRGFDAVHGQDLEVTLQGIPLNEWSNIHGQGYLDLGFILPETIAHLDATKGPFSDKQGAFAMAGSVNYELGIPEENRGLRAHYSAGTTHRHRAVLTFSPQGSDGTEFVALEGLHDQGYGQNRSIHRGSFMAQWNLVDSPTDGRLSLLTSAYLAGFELPGSLRNEDVRAGRVEFLDSYDSAGKGLSGRGLLAVTYTRNHGGNDVRLSAYGGYRRLELLENYTGFLLDPTFGDRRQQKQTTFEWGVLGEDTIALHRRAAIHVGASVHGDALTQSQDQLGLKLQPVEAQRSLSSLQVQLSGYGSLRWRPLDPLSITLGGRVDAMQVLALDQLSPQENDLGLLFAASPRLTVEYRVLSPWQLFFAYGRGFRPPEARAFSSYEPAQTGISEELYEGGAAKNTFSDALELGTRLSPSRFVDLLAAGFATFISREAVFDHVSGQNLELNATRRLGLEVDLRVVPLSWLTLAADVTWVEARFVQSKNPVPFAPWLSGAIHALLTHPSGWRAGLRFFGLAPRELPHGAQGAAMAVLDATLGYHWHHFRLDLALENLLSRKIREGEYHYASDWDPDDGISQIPVLHTVAGPPLNARLGLTIVY